MQLLKDRARRTRALVSTCLASAAIAPALQKARRTISWQGKAKRSNFNMSLAYGVIVRFIRKAVSRDRSCCFLFKLYLCRWLLLLRLQQPTSPAGMRQGLTCAGNIAKDPSRPSSFRFEWFQRAEMPESSHPRPWLLGSAGQHRHVHGRQNPGQIHSQRRGRQTGSCTTPELNRTRF
jgi:hypothetical protein